MMTTHDVLLQQTVALCEFKKVYRACAPLLACCSRSSSLSQLLQGRQHGAIGKLAVDKMHTLFTEQLELFAAIGVVRALYVRTLHVCAT